jgi:putative hydrolase of the HAD superfamily
MRFVLCDVGGVLLKLSFNRALEFWSTAGSCALPITREGIFDRLFCEFETGGISAKDYLKHLGNKLGASLTESQIIEGWNSIFMSVDPDVEELIGELRKRGTPVIGVTNTNVLHKEYWTRRYPGIIPTFDFFYSSIEIGFRKPDRAIFEYILDVHDFRKEEGVFIDDVRENTEGAEAFGLPSILFSGAAQLRIELGRRGFL